MRWAAAAIVAVFLVIYLPGAGHGFIADDFRWIAEGRVDGPADLPRVLASNVGFYRPLVMLSFAADYAVWGGTAPGYGLTNVGLCLAAAAALFALARQMRLSLAASLVATSVWLFNFHAINMAVLWLSGRTALLVTLFSLAAANAVFRERPMVAGMMCFLALLSKEEAVALPPLFTALHVLERGPARAAFRLLPLWTALAVYLALRWHSGAFWASDAPPFYQFSASPAVLLRNAAEYADRAGTVAAVSAMAFVAAGRVRRAHLTAEERRAFRVAAVWIPAMFALTVALPVRSSLYALLPSAGAALAAGVVASAAERRAPVRFARTAMVLLALVALLVPVYRSRNARWVQLADLSSRAMSTIARDLEGRPAGHVVLVDAPDERFNLMSAFGNLLPEALLLRLGPGWTGEIVTGVADVPVAAEVVYRLENGRLVGGDPGGP